MSLLPSQDPCMSCARHCLISSLTNTVSITGVEAVTVASAMGHLVFEIETTFLFFHESFTQPGWRSTFESRFEFRQQLFYRSRLVHFHGENVFRYRPRRARS